MIMAILRLRALWLIAAVVLAGTGCVAVRSCATRDEPRLMDSDPLTR